MNSGRRIIATVEAGVPPAFQSSSQPTRLPLQKDKITIRDAKLGDAPALAALMCELGYETSNVEMDSRLQAILRNASYSTIVAEIDNKLCGMIGTLTHTATNTTILPERLLLSLFQSNSDEVALAARSSPQRRRISREETLAE